ncbi:MAG TPA: efflux RND transporter periplasmic adaptor subunit [bacterium]|nr:efflux RND transporter periplasmic adaptor subunit [bacterium]
MKKAMPTSPGSAPARHSVAQAPAAAPTQTEAWYRQPLARRAGLAALGLAFLGLLYWALWIHPYVSTDDARVAATIARVAPQGLGGQVLAVNVAEGDAVKAGQALVQLDPDVAQARLQQARARALLARRELNRTEQLADHKGVSERQLDEARAASGAADADERLAELALRYCTLSSPFDGRVVQKPVDVGNQIETGQTAVTVADLDHAWIEANVEETEAGALEPGQEVKVWVDEGGRLHGKVLEVLGATLSSFALLPSDNSSGNFVKLVQRVPVKIALDPHPGLQLRVGQSVEIKVRVH